MTKRLRVIDTGIRDGRRQIAFDQALIDLHGAGRIPDTVRFLRFETCALVGRHQAVNRELKVDYCLQQNVRIVRRITGGGAIYFDPGQLGWELVLSRKRFPMPTLADYTRAICEAVAHGLSEAFGIDARFRERNDIEVGGQKLCGTGGFFDGDTLFYQGTVLVDADPAKVMACLNVPRAKLEKRDLDKPEQRVTTLKSLLGQAPAPEVVQRAILSGLADKFGISFYEETASLEEEAMAAKLHEEEFGLDAFVFSIDEPDNIAPHKAVLTGPGGTVTAHVRLDGKAPFRRVQDVLFTGDFFVTPPRTILDLEAHIRGVDARSAGEAVDKFFELATPDLLTITPSSFKEVIETAILNAEI